MINRDYLDVITDYFEQENYLESIDYLENCITQGCNQPNHYYWLGLAYLLADNWEGCLATWLSLIVETSLEDENERLVVDLIDFLEQQIRFYLTKRKLRQAKIIYEIIFELNTDYENAEILAQLTSALYKMATNYGLNQEYDKAIIVYLDLLDFNPDYSPAWHSLALCHYHQGNYAEAHTTMQEALERDSSDNNYYGLGRILEKQQDYGGAISAYNQAIELNPDFLDVYITLGNLHYEQKNVDRALNCYEHLLKKSNEVGQPQIKQRVEEIYHTNQYPQAAQYLGYFYYSKDKYAQAIHYYKDYLCQESGDIETYLNLGQSYARTNQTAKAIHFIEQKLESYPDNLSLRTFHQSILPIVFEKNEDIEFYRQRYQSLLEKLLIDYLPNTLDKANEAFAGTQKNNLFYLAYQGKNDVVIQQKYTTYLSSILKIAYPQFCQPKIFSDDIHRRKLRVGLVSQHLEGLGKLYVNWLKYLDSQKFDFYTYDLSRVDPHKPEETRDQFQLYSHQMWYLGKNENLIDLCQKIDSDHLDILIMPEIAVSARVGPLACLRLAPIQCTTWAHPVTSGSPYMDYFLSSHLMEPDNGDEHYSETLIRLPNLAFAIGKKEVILHEKNRSDFGLRQDSVIFWCCQSLFKYLPEHDYIFATVAQHSPTFQFAFIESDHSPIVTETFKKRLQATFRQLDLNYEDYCLFLPRLNRSDFSIVTQLSDIFLDCLSWSGGFTTTEAIIAGLPIVTCPGELMRARHSYGLLTMIGITETIAESIENYIAIAVRLGLDRQWRQAISQKILENGDRMFEDQACITALEAFFQDAVEKKQQMDDG